MKSSKSEMRVFYYGGPSPFSLRVDDQVVGYEASLGIEDETGRGAPGGILSLMVRFGADCEKAARFLRDFKKAAGRPGAEGVPPQISALFRPEDYR
jgi:hypothetical protein